ncbi:MAG: YncE family protein [Thermoplasmata archaeon]
MSSPLRRASKLVPTALVLLVAVVLLATVVAPAVLRVPATVGTISRHAASHEAVTVSAALPALNPSGGIGVVLSRLDLSSNQAYPGPGALPVQSNLQQETATYDPSNGNIYVRGGTANDLSVINASTFTDVANIPVPVDNQATFNVPSVAVDNETGTLYATNAGSSSNVSIISGTSETVTGSLPVGGGPHGIAFDWRNHDLYVADFGTANVTVFSGTTNKSVASIPVGTDPLAVAYDSPANRVFVTNYGSSNVSIINPVTNRVVASATVRPEPIALAIDTKNDLIDVLNNTGRSLADVSVFSATASAPVVTNVSVALYAESFAYDPAQNQLFVAGGQGLLTVIQQPSNTVVSSSGIIGQGAGPSATAYDAVNGNVIISAYNGGPSGIGNITVINGSTHKSIANISTEDGPYAVIVDPGTGDGYVANGGTSDLEPNVTVLSEATGLSIASIPIAVYPTGVTYDAAQKALYSVDSAGNDVHEVNAAADQVVGVDVGGPHPTSTSVEAPVAYDGANGDIYTADSAVAAVEVFSSSHTLLTTINVGQYPDALAYDNASKRLFVANDYNGNVSIINTSTNTLNTTSLKVKPVAQLDAIAYDARTNEVYAADRGDNNVTVWGASNDSKLRTIDVGSEPDSIVVDSKNHTVFVANLGSGNVSVIDDSTLKVVHSVPLVDPYILAYDSGTETIYNAESFENVIDAFNATTYVALSGSPLYLEAGGGYYVEGIAYDPVTGDLYVSDSTGDALITVGPVPSYPVDFQETGLRQGTPWSVTLNGTEMTSFSPLIGFTEFAGSYQFTIGPVPGYTSTPTFGTVTVPDPHQPINITFSSEYTPPTPVSALYAVYDDRPDLQAAYPAAFINFTNFTGLVNWAGGVVTHAFSDTNYSDLSPFGYWYALLMTYNSRSDLQAAFTEPYGNLTNYTQLVNWAGGVVTGEWVDSANATLSPFGYYYDLMNVYDGRTDLQAAFPQAFTNLTNFTLLVNWAGWVVNDSFFDSDMAKLTPFGYYYALLKVYDGRSDLQAAFPFAFTDGASYAGLLAWADAVVRGTITDSAKTTLLLFAASYEALG